MVGSALFEQHRAFVDAVVNRFIGVIATGGVIAAASDTMDQSKERHDSTIMHRIVQTKEYSWLSRKKTSRL